MFAFTAYVINEVLESFKKIYELLIKAIDTHSVANNVDDSYLTMRSKEGAIFFVINLIRNFGTVFLNNGLVNPEISIS